MSASESANLAEVLLDLVPNDGSAIGNMPVRLDCSFAFTFVQALQGEPFLPYLG